MNKQMLQRSLVLLVALALALSMLGCGDKKPRVKRGDSTDDTVVEEPSKDVVIAQGNQPANSGTATAAAPKASANPFEGTWDVNVSGSFFNWTFGYATKKDQKLEGKITDASNAVVGEYIVLPNKTVELIVYAASLNSIVPYKVSNSGNQIDIDDGPTKVTMTKGKTQTTTQNDGNVLASHTWTNISNPGHQFQFTSVRKSSSGWNGAYNEIHPGGRTDSGTFSLTPGKITLTMSGNVDVFTYKLRLGNTILDVTDSSGNTNTFQ